MIPKLLETKGEWLFKYSMAGFPKGSTRWGGESYCFSPKQVSKPKRMISKQFHDLKISLITESFF